MILFYLNVGIHVSLPSEVKTLNDKLHSKCMLTIFGNQSWCTMSPWLQVDDYAGVFGDKL